VKESSCFRPDAESSPQLFFETEVGGGFGSNVLFIVFDLVGFVRDSNATPESDGSGRSVGGTAVEEME
jgi:hypothetical protein